VRDDDSCGLGFPSYHELDRLRVVYKRR